MVATMARKTEAKEAAAAGKAQAGQATAGDVALKAAGGTTSGRGGEDDALVREYRRLFAEESRIARLPEGGVARMALTEGDHLQRSFLARELQRAGATVRVDQIGNLFGLFAWKNDAPYVLAGSHLDSQPNGGVFDGAYGVMAALACCKHLDAQVRAGKLAPACNVAVVDWTNEEGARFEPSVMGSSVFVGALSAEEAKDSCDVDGVRLGDELKRWGWEGSDSGPWACAYAELHVEQGTRLHEAGVDLGVVDGSWGAVKMRVEVTGEQAHTGTTPMGRRHDALYGAALVVCAVRDLADSFEGAELRTSVTKLSCEPSSPNVVTARCSMHVELRAESVAAAQAAAQNLWGSFVGIGRKARVRIEMKDVSVRDSAAFWEPGLALCEEEARRLGLSAMRLKAECGHDAIALDGFVPTVLLFAPSETSAAHAPDELTSEPDQENGVRALARVLERLVAQGV